MSEQNCRIQKIGIEIKIREANEHELHRRDIFFASDKSELRTKQCPIFAASLQPVKPYLVNELLNEGYLGHKRLYYGDTTQLCMLIQLMLIKHEISWLWVPKFCSIVTDNDDIMIYLCVLNIGLGNVYF